MQPTFISRLRVGSLWTIRGTVGVDSTSLNDFLPSASLEKLRSRATILRALRLFFEQQKYWEVQTPVLSRDVVIDANIEPFAISDANKPKWFLQTSPEFAMKRLLAAGADSIFQIGPAFRQHELGELHNLEFTIVEWYRVGDTHFDQMEFTEALVRVLFQAASELHHPENIPWRTVIREPFERLTYDEAFQRHIGQGVLSKSTTELPELAHHNGVVPPESLRLDDRDGWLNLLLSELVEPHLGVERPVFLHDYPASQAALAIVRNDTHPVAERFELYINGIELCNGYHELTDAEELVSRNQTQQARRQQENRPELPSESQLLDAMTAGLPGCAGVAMGFDRLVMLALGATSLAEVIAFPSDRA
jgi:elongation factor P--(R)-beta-lysine ligase